MTSRCTVQTMNELLQPAGDRNIRGRLCPLRAYLLWELLHEGNKVQRRAVSVLNYFARFGWGSWLCSYLSDRMSFGTWGNDIEAFDEVNRVKDSTRPIEKRVEVPAGQEGHEPLQPVREHGGAARRGLRPSLPS